MDLDDRSISISIKQANKGKGVIIMSDEQMAELRREMDYKLSIIEKAREEDRDSIISFHKSFGEFRVQLADHFAKDIARDKQIADLVKTVTVSNGQPSLIKRVETVERYIAYVVGASVILGIIWSIIVFIVPLWMRTK
jgi:hypothetical protein